MLLVCQETLSVQSPWSNVKQFIVSLVRPRRGYGRGGTPEVLSFFLFEARMDEVRGPRPREGADARTDHPASPVQLRVIHVDSAGEGALHQTQQKHRKQVPRCDAVPRKPRNSTNHQSSEGRLGRDVRKRQKNTPTLTFWSLQSWRNRSGSVRPRITRIFTATERTWPRVGAEN